MEGVIMSNNKRELYLRIAEKAYSYYVTRGFQHGNHMADWLRAEKEILKDMGKSETKETKAKRKK